MLINWLMLIPAALLLLAPTGAFHGNEVRYRAVSRDWSNHWRQFLAYEWHWIDFIRAAAGTWLLSTALTRAPGASGLAGQSAFLTQVGVIAFAMLLQTAVCREPDAARAPFAFIVGLVCGWLPPLIAGFGVVFAFTLAAGARSPAAFFPLLAVSVGAAGYLFTGKRLALTLAAFAAITLVPWLYALLFNRTLVVAYRSRTGSASPLRRSDTNPPTPSEARNA
jgi:hypothetical protein